MADEELRGSTPMMTAKELLLDVWRQTNTMAPQLDALVKADLIARVTNLEQVNRDGVSRVNERNRLGALTNKVVVAVVIIGQLILGVIVLIANNKVAVPS